MKLEKVIISTDYEIAPTNALKLVFPQYKLAGYLFHLVKSYGANLRMKA